MDALSGIEKLMALDAIERLKAQRDRAADTKDWALYESLHAPDHVSENGDYGRWTSAAEMIANVKRSMESLVTLHHSHTPIIEFETSTRARCIWAMEGMSFWQHSGQERWFHAFGHYFETCEKRDGRWVYTSRSLKYYHTRRSPGAEWPPKIDQ